MIERRITLTRLSDSHYCKLVEMAEKDGVFDSCNSVADKKLWVKFESEEKEREWLVKVGLIR